MTGTVWPVAVLFLVSALVGVFAAETKRGPLLAVFKPLTTILLLAVVGWPRTRFAWLVDLGIAFSLGGDVALLFSAKPAFLVGLGLFLVAHVLYIVAFVLAFLAATAAGAAGWHLPVAAAILIMAVVTVVLLRKLWPGAAGMRPAVTGYALALGTMVVTACAAVSTAGAPASAAVGAILFYVSDASLATDKFAAPIKHAPILTLGFYWLGQLGIALAARYAGA